ncbi:MAG: hypothetical protein CMF48_07625 [Legionellales bacterium]|nr:hypothetical protein [Legionellales bacterium]|tara:strand:- start:544 stop:1806 length:1263 start_codon:yes stop_codon:yes gene_type:complete
MQPSPKAEKVLSEADARLALSAVGLALTRVSPVKGLLRVAAPTRDYDSTMSQLVATLQKDNEMFETIGENTTAYWLKKPLSKAAETQYLKEATLKVGDSEQTVRSLLERLFQAKQDKNEEETNRLLNELAKGIQTETTQNPTGDIALFMNIFIRMDMIKDKCEYGSDSVGRKAVCGSIVNLKQIFGIVPPVDNIFKAKEEELVWTEILSEIVTRAIGPESKYKIIVKIEDQEAAFKSSITAAKNASISKYYDDVIEQLEHIKSLTKKEIKRGFIDALKNQCERYRSKGILIPLAAMINNLTKDRNSPDESKGFSEANLKGHGCAPDTIREFQQVAQAFEDLLKGKADTDVVCQADQAHPAKKSKLMTLSRDRAAQSWTKQLVKLASTAGYPQQMKAEKCRSLPTSEPRKLAARRRGLKNQ